MGHRNAFLIFFAIALVPLAAVLYFVHRDMTAPPPELTPTGHNYGSPTLGDGRFALLQSITRDYVASHPDAPAEMREGKALAPREELNRQLTAKSEKWRVRTVNGLVADTYEVT